MHRPRIPHSALTRLLAATAALCSTPAAASVQAADDPPNIVLMFPDNLGWGEVGAYGGVRDVPTPNIDRIAEEGIRLNNFNVEYSCTVSRIALLTGRYAARAGGTQGTGMTLWEVRIAEALRDRGYATALFGKWHVGGDDWQSRREPQDQGFDEWYGIPGTSHVSQFGTFETWDPETMEQPHIWEGVAGEPSRRVKPYDMETRRILDREAAEHGIDFMERSVAAGRPFFFYYPITQIHFPTLPHPDFAGAPLGLRYALDGSETLNTVMMGRGFQEQHASARWEGESLVIVTRYVDPQADGGRGVVSEVRQTLSYQPAGYPAFPPQLVIEIVRGGALGGAPSTTRAIYGRR